jgi:uncharacterized membrane protein YcaP (DUF421 family)
MDAHSTHDRSSRGLELEDNESFQRHEWRWQQIGLWVVLLALVAAGVVRTGTPALLMRAALLYGFLLVMFRIAGKRTLAQMTGFDLVLILVIGDATQQALIGDDFTLGTAMLAIGSLVLLDAGLGYLKAHAPRVDRVLDGLPLLLVDRGRLLEDRMAREGIDVSDLMTAGREQHGIRQLSDIEYAVLERSGGLSVIPKRLDR